MADDLVRQAAAKEVAENLNSIFHAEFSWHETEGKAETVSRRDVENALIAIRKILPRLNERDFLLLVEAIIACSNAVTWALADRTKLRSLGFSGPQLSYSYFMRWLDEADDPNPKLNRPPRVNLKWDEYSKELRSLLDEFYDVERSILERAGLDQAAVATIIFHLKHNDKAIFEHLLIGTSFYRQQFAKAAKVAERTLERVSSQKASGDEIRTRSMKTFKAKIVGLATVWANAVPLLVAQDWGVASVFSTTAGATAAAILPRKGRKIS